jgi:hypothetical protein
MVSHLRIKTIKEYESLYEQARQLPNVNYIGYNLMNTLKNI